MAQAIEDSLNEIEEEGYSIVVSQFVSGRFIILGQLREANQNPLVEVLANTLSKQGMPRESRVSGGLDKPTTELLDGCTKILNSRQGSLGGSVEAVESEAFTLARESFKDAPPDVVAKSIQDINTLMEKHKVECSEGGDCDVSEIMDLARSALLMLQRSVAN